MAQILPKPFFLMGIVLNLFACVDAIFQTATKLDLLITIKAPFVHTHGPNNCSRDNRPTVSPSPPSGGFDGYNRIASTGMHRFQQLGFCIGPESGVRFENVAGYTAGYTWCRTSA